MALFISTYINKIDKKGRVSVPASFRASLADQPYKGIISILSGKHECIDCFDWNTMEDISSRIDNFDMFSEEQDDFATSIFGNSVQLPFDGDGRIILPSDLIEEVGVSDKAAFVGLGKKFQIWCPEKLKTRKEQARSNVKNKSMTIPKGGNSD